ncbi:phoH-like protein, partial [Vibrio parahaemolyticus V-223/04]
FVHCTTHYSRC